MVLDELIEFAPLHISPVKIVREESVEVVAARHVKETVARMNVSEERLKQVMRSFLVSMQDGLDRQKAHTSVLKMLPSFVQSLPDGSERGRYLALDLGGTNFRVLLITIAGEGEADMAGKIYRVPDSLMKGDGVALFDHIADCLHRFVEEQGMKGDERLPLGFTFSFPCEQHGLTSATLLHWTKGFSATNVVGNDVVRMLKEACSRRKDIAIDVVAVLNDTVGTLMACAFKESTCQVGVIVGTGTNACYMERVDRCTKLENVEGHPDEMIINMEWGAFGDDGTLDFVRTEFDLAVDMTSINPKRQTFEKMVSGMYLGEVVRFVLLKLARERTLFQGDFQPLAQHGAFPTKFVSEIELDASDPDTDWSQTCEVIKSIGIDTVSSADCAHVAAICAAVSRRAAHLVAAALATLILRIDKPHVTIGVDGSVYRFHPTFKDLLELKIQDLLDDHPHTFDLMLSEDGSGRGAALVAAVAHRLGSQKRQPQ